MWIGVFLRTSITYLSSAEEYLCVTETVFIVVVNPIVDNLRARRFEIVIDNLRALAEQTVTCIEIVVLPARRKSSSRYSHGFQNATGSQLLHYFRWFPFEGFFIVVGLLGGERKVDGYMQWNGDEHFVLPLCTEHSVEWLRGAFESACLSSRGTANQQIVCAVWMA